MLDHTIDKNPGKFEGEPEYLKKFYDQAMGSRADEEVQDLDGTFYQAFFLSDDEQKDLGNEVLVLWDSDQGFAYHELMSKAQWEGYLADIAADTEENEIY